MIGKIKGILSFIDGSKALVDTAGGVSYEIFLTPQVLNRSSVGNEIEVTTYLQVREDGMSLFGFESRSQYKLFTLFLGVDGVGPKSAFNIISHTDSDGIMNAVTTGTVDYFSSVPGIGKKTAQKILLELSHKLANGFDMDVLHVSTDDKLVYDALITLGFRNQEINTTLSQIDKSLSVEERIKTAIQLLTTKK